MAQTTRTAGLSKTDHVLRTLQREIMSGIVSHGDRLDSEKALMKRFSVSRNTIRKGLDELAQQGLIAKRSGVGSFAIYEGKVIDDSLGSRAQPLDQLELETQFTGIRRDSCSRINRFSVSHDTVLPEHANDYLRIDRVHYNRIDGMGLLIVRSRLPWRDEYQTIVANGLIEDSLGKTLSGMNIHVHSGKEWISVLPELAHKDAELMRRQSEGPMLQLHRISCDTDGKLIEYAESILDPVRFNLHLSF